MKFEQILDTCKKLNETKRLDYTNSTINRFENFDRANEVGSWFKKDRDKAFAIQVGNKLARLGALLSSERVPNYESVQDSFFDLITYTTIWAERNDSYARPREDKVQQELISNYQNVNQPGEKLPSLDLKPSVQIWWDKDKVDKVNSLLQGIDNEMADRLIRNLETFRALNGLRA